MTKRIRVSTKKKLNPKNPTPKKIHKKLTVQNPAKNVVFGFLEFFENKSLLWSTKRLRIVLGYIRSIKTMNNNLNNLQICYKNAINNLNKLFGILA